MSSVTKPILLDETGQAIVSKLVDIKNAIQGQSPAGEPVMITVVTPPTKTEYAVGDTFDPTGIVVSAIFTNGLYYNITNECSYSPSTPLTFDDEEVTVSWTWHETGHTFITKQAITMGAASWSTGTDAQIVASLQAHYDGIIDITDYWSVGDERTVHLSAMAATGVGETHVAQDVVMVLMNEGGKTLSDGVTECAFIVGQKDALTDIDGSGYFREAGYMHPNNTDMVNWSNCARRTWCNEVYRNAIPSSLRSIFKQHKNLSTTDSTPSTVTTDDYFSLPAEKEVYGASNPHPYADTTAEATLSQFKYYETTSNRVKNPEDSEDVDGEAYLFRSHSVYGGTVVNTFCVYRYNNYGGNMDADTARNIAPFGVI